MKGLLYFPINIDIFPDSSIAKKNNHIVSAFENLNVEVDTVRFSNRGIFKNQELIKKIPNYKFVRGIYNNLLGFRVVRKSFDFKEYDFVWFRAGLCLPPQLSLLRAIRKNNPNTRIILEYGSYPFKGELFGYQKLLFPFSERLSKRLKKYVSYVLTYCGQDTIYGIPSIKIGNGVDVQQIKRHAQRDLSGNRLNLVSVSGMMYWHALDRMILGFERYYKEGGNKLGVVLHIVGDSPERVKLEKMVCDAKLKDKIIFHDFKTGEELNKIFDQSHLAIGTLGMHRKNLSADSSLKNREYTARGLPFVLSTPDDDFPEVLPFVKYLPPDDSAIDIKAVIDFYKNIAAKYPNYSRLIREYAEENLTWESKLRKVLSVIRQRNCRM